MKFTNKCGFETTGEVKELRSYIESLELKGEIEIYFKDGVTVFNIYTRHGHKSFVDIEFKGIESVKEAIKGLRRLISVTGMSEYD